MTQQQPRSNAPEGLAGRRAVAGAAVVPSAAVVPPATAVPLATAVPPATAVAHMSWAWLPKGQPAVDKQTAMVPTPGPGDNGGVATGRG